MNNDHKSEMQDVPHNSELFANTDKCNDKSDHIVYTFILNRRDN